MWHFPNSADESAYEEALVSTIRTFGIRITLIFVNGTRIVVPKEKIVSSNPSLSSQATNSTSLNIGSAVIDTINFSTDLNTSGISSARTTTTKFFVEAGYGADADNIKYVPIGYYRMQSKNCSLKEGCYNLSLQSYMAAFDKNLPKVFSGVGTVANWLTWVCSRVKLFSGLKNSAGETVVEPEYATLSSQMTAEYLASLPNSNIEFTINQDTGYSTYRDIIKDLAVVSCCFATIDTDGGLIFKPFCQVNSNISKGIVQTIDKNRITSIAENVGECDIEEVRCILSRTSGNETVEYDYGYPQGLDDINYYDISDTKILKTIEPIERANGISAEIFNKIGFSSGYTPTPFDVTLDSPDFRLQVGDWITIKNIDDTEFSAQLMKIGYSMPGKCTLKSFSNPSNNDTNATMRSSYTDRGESTGGGGGGEVVKVVDQTAQWHFNS